MHPDYDHFCVCVQSKKICNCLSSFFSFFSSRHFLWTDWQKFFSECIIISYGESVWPRSDSFLGHTKKSFPKNCSSNCYSRRVWHMTGYMQSNQHSSIQESTRNSEKLGNKLAVNQTSYSVNGRRFNGQKRKKSSW